MARKAVQGYPEKSYYDNTRYLGIVATTDPLNEGLFKHMVNFDVSDTGQSVEPRDGFLTTTFKNSLNVITVSNKTIIFKDNNTNEYVIYDLLNNVGYLADVSAYKIIENYLPITQVITGLDWTSVVDFLVSQVTFIKNYYNAVVGNDTVKYQTTRDYIRQYLSILADTKVNHIYDENGISKTLIRVSLEVPNQAKVNIILQMFYRKDPITLNNIVVGSGNTLVFEVVDTFTHPTLATTDRNLAVSKSIIPEVFQTLYTTVNRPDGHISNLGNFVYVYDEALNYVNNFIFRNVNYNIKPYFSLNPAVIDLNNELNEPNKWAYKFELFNTSTEITDKTKSVLFSSPWMKYEGSTVKPTPVFTANRDNVISLNNAEKINNHYLGSRYVIFLVPKTTTKSRSTVVNGTETLNSGKDIYGEFFEQEGIPYGTFRDRYNSWKNSIDSIKDLRTLRIAITNLSVTANFYIYNLNEDANVGTFVDFDKSMETSQKSEVDTHKIVATVDSEYDMFLTGTQLLKRIEDENIFKNTYNIVFKFLPYASKDTVTVETTISSFISDPRFLTQSPYYVSGSPEGNLTTLVNIRVQDKVSGKVYKQTTSPQGATYEEISFTAGTYPTLGFSDAGILFSITTGSAEVIGTFSDKNICTGLLVTGTGIPANTYVLYKKNDTTVVISNNATATNASVALTMTVAVGGLVFSFANNFYYTDTRTSRYFQWRNVSTTVGQLTSTANPGTNKVEYRWFFAALNYFNVDSELDYLTYRMKKNTFVNNVFGFFRYNLETNKYTLETGIDTLKNQSLPFLNFTSSSFFNTQAPYYYDGGINPTGLWITQEGDEAPWVGNPGAPNDPNIQDEWFLTDFLVAPIDTIVQYSDQEGSYFYKNTAGNVWTLLGTTSNQTVSWINPIDGRIYKDLRTNVYYQWNNFSKQNGIFTVINSFDYPDLNGPNFFDKGLSGIFYMRPYEDSELLNESGQSKTFEELETLKVAWGASSYRQTFNLTYGLDLLTVTYIEKQLTKEPLDIANSNNLAVFEDSQLLTWINNVLYISEPGRYYWFKATKKFEFGEEIVKAIQYKQLILVFTTQHLYAIYRVETISTRLNPATNQLEQDVTGVAWLKQIVLYNLLVNKEYADVIQIFNQMILFYSEDGQLFMIRPSSQIDDQTRFSIQYFNKAANDILKNYHIYINERLASYGSPMRVTKSEIKIKALVSINFIKLIYYVPGVITYMLIYDVINNRYTAYDSLTFTNVFDKWFIESGDLLVTEQNNKLYFTVPYVEVNTRDNHVDMSFTNNFKKEGINCLIDTGNMNLNNHLFKRFRDLHVTFKNLNAGNVLFNLETMIDEIVAKPFYDEKLQVIDTNNVSYYVTVKTEDKKDLIQLVDVNQISEVATDVVKYSLTNNLFENNNMLMDFSEYTSSKLLTHRTSILGLGKVFRLKLQFISKGLYKLQNFGIIYKERRI